MREIKFRGWHTVRKKMFSAEEMTADQLTLLPTGSFINVSGDSVRLIPLQYTSLRDKNGKDIYEGDIIQDVQMIKVRKELAIHEIVFVGGSFCMKSAVETIPIFAHDGNILDNMEIIGNIYENEISMV